MAETNPYGAPKARVAEAAEPSVAAEKLASGQKLLIYAILLNLGSLVVAFVFAPLAPLATIAALVLSIIGIVRLGAGFGFSVVVRILLCILMLVPLVNLIALLVLNSRATTRLREAGYTVGLLGASRPA